MLINLHEQSEPKFPGENAVIGGITFDLAGSAIKDLMYELHGHYNKKELNEVIFACKLDITPNDSFSYDLAVRIQQEFRKAGGRITGFAGRRGIVSLENVVKAI